jgi:hypothetical protein
MKKSPLFAVACLAFAALAPTSPATPAQPAPSFEERLKSFQQSAAAILLESTSGERENKTNMGFNALSQLSQFNVDQAQPDFKDLERRLASITLLAPDNPELARAAEALLATAKAEREARIAGAQAAFESLLKKAGEACLAAKKPADLDRTLLALAPYSRESGYERRPEDPVDRRRAAAAYRFVSRWQDYLVARSAPDNSEPADNILREISSEVDPVLMPRSTILALINPAFAAAPGEAPNGPHAAAAAILEAGSTTDDLVAALRALPRDSSIRDTGSLQKVLIALLDERQQVRSGQRTHSLFSEARHQLSPQDPAYTPRVQAALFAFRRQTQLDAVRSLISRPELPAPTDTETPEAYALRIVEHFAHKRDWLLTRDALEVYRECFSLQGSSDWLFANTTALNAYLVGINLELAGQPTAAVISYRETLRRPSRYLPIDEITERLAALKQSSPEAFQEPSPNSGTPKSRTQGADPYAAPIPPRGSLELRPAPTGPQAPAATPQTP